jgi:ATP-dependent DNA helicase RecG
MKLRLKESINVEFKKSFDNEAIEALCAFANTKGGRVIVGIDDRGKAVGIELGKESIQNWINEVKTKTAPSLVPDAEEIRIRGRVVVELSIKEYPVKPVAFKGRYYKRINNSNHLMSTEEVANLHLRTFNVSWDYYPDLEHNLEQLSLPKVRRFISQVNQNNPGRINDDPLRTLKKYELIRKGKLSRACFLLFMKEESLFSTIELGRFQSSTIIKDALTVKTDLISEVEAVMEFIRKHLNKEYIFTGKARREERWTYPLEALREIVLNMIIHRDYAKASDSIVKIFDDRIEFYNPGRLLPGLTVKNLLKGDYVSNIRNKQIAKVFKEIGLIEKYGSGIARIIRAFKEYSLRQPVFKEISDGFMVVVFSKSTQKPTQKPTQKTDLQIKIIKAITRDPHITRKELSNELKVSENTLKENLFKLKVKKSIRRIGPDKGGHWEVLNNPQLIARRRK